MSSLEQLWAGWRRDYITSIPDEAHRDGTCVFCRILASGAPDDETHVVWRHPDGDVVALLNAYPYASGHVMVMPVRHVANLEDMGAEELSLIHI